MLGSRTKTNKINDTQLGIDIQNTQLQLGRSHSSGLNQIGLPPPTPRALLTLALSAAAVAVFRPNRPELNGIVWVPEVAAAAEIAFEVLGNRNKKRVAYEHRLGQLSHELMTAQQPRWCDNRLLGSRIKKTKQTTPN